MNTPEDVAKTPLTVDMILKERGSRYGSFRDNSRISQKLSYILADELCERTSRGQCFLEAYQREALEMIFHKIARIVSGDDPGYADNWDDIAGYAQLGKEPR